MFETSTYQILIPFLVGLAAAATSWHGRTFWNPSSLVIVWWGFWLWIATFSLTGVYAPSEKCIFTVFVFLVGIVASTLLERRPSTGMPIVGAFDLKSDSYYRLLRRAFPWIGVMAGLIVVPAFARGVYGFLTYGRELRAYAFTGPEQVSFIFKSAILESLYFTVSGPLLLLLLLFGMAVYLRTDRIWELIIAIVFNLMDAIMRLGRVNIYMICLFLIIGFALMVGPNGFFSGKRAKKLIFAGAMLIVLATVIIGIGVARNDKIVQDSRDHFDVFVIDYHTIGFALFDSELKDPDSELNKKLTYGRLAAGGLETVFTFVIRRFDRSYNSPANLNTVRMAEYKVVGEKRVGEGEPGPKKFNAFYTIIYSLYSDGRFVGLILGGLALGWAMARANRIWKEVGSFEALVWIFFLVSICIFGIFVSTLEMTRTWFVGGVLGFAHLVSAAQNRSRELEGPDLPEAPTKIVLSNKSADEITVFVTGATGFVGGRLCRILSERKGWNVIGSGRSEPSAELAPYLSSFIKTDLSKSPVMSGVLQNVGVVIHLASRVHNMSDSGQESLRKYREANVIATRSLAKQAAATGVRRLVFVSTIKVNGDKTTRLPFTGADAPKPIDAYSLSKLEAEKELMVIAQETGLEVVILRPPLVYGPGVRANFLSLMRWAAKGLPLPLGSVKNRRSLLYIDNLCEALAVAAVSPAAKNKIFTVSDDGALSTMDLIDKLSSSLGAPSRVWPFPVAALKGMAAVLGLRPKILRLVESLEADNSQFKRETGWRPVNSTDEGLRETAKWYLEQPR